MLTKIGQKLRTMGRFKSIKYSYFLQSIFSAGISNKWQEQGSNPLLPLHFIEVNREDYKLGQSKRQREVL